MASNVPGAFPVRQDCPAPCSRPGEARKRPRTGWLSCCVHMVPTVGYLYVQRFHVGSPRLCASNPCLASSSSGQDTVPHLTSGACPHLLPCRLSLYKQVLDLPQILSQLWTLACAFPLWVPRARFTKPGAGIPSGAPALNVRDTRI